MDEVEDLKRRLEAAKKHGDECSAALEKCQLRLKELERGRQGAGMSKDKDERAHCEAAAHECNEHFWEGGFEDDAVGWLSYLAEAFARERAAARREALEEAVTLRVPTYARMENLQTVEGPPLIGSPSRAHYFRGWSEAMDAIRALVKDGES